MSAYRNGIGQIKRTADSRNFRRLHLQGAMRLVRWKERPVESFKGRMLATLTRLIAKSKVFA